MDRRVLRLNSIKSCEVFAANAQERGFSELADEARMRAAQLRKQAYDNGARRPDIDYHIIGLKNGDRIFLPELGVTAEIASHRTLYYQGREVYITPLESELVEAGFASRDVRGKWRAESNGELINDMYSAIYPKE